MALWLTEHIPWHLEVFTSTRVFIYIQLHQKLPSLTAKALPAIWKWMYGLFITDESENLRMKRRFGNGQIEARNIHDFRGVFEMSNLMCVCVLCHLPHICRWSRKKCNANRAKGDILHLMHLILGLLLCSSRLILQWRRWWKLFIVTPDGITALCQIFAFFWRRSRREEPRPETLSLRSGFWSRSRRRRFRNSETTRCWGGCGVQWSWTIESPDVKVLVTEQTRRKGE